MADLIERYKITANLPSVLMNYCNRFNSKQLESITEMIYELENSIESADVQPVKHGRWIDIYEWAKMHDSIPSGMCLYYWCSECQEEQEKKSNFCPHCGARMDGDTNG